MRAGSGTARQYQLTTQTRRRASASLGVSCRTSRRHRVHRVLIRPASYLAASHIDVRRVLFASQHSLKPSIDGWTRWLYLAKQELRVPNVLRWFRWVERNGKILPSPVLYFMKSYLDLVLGETNYFLQSRHLHLYLHLPACRKDK